jgi:hypothetical protein
MDTRAVIKIIEKRNGKNGGIKQENLKGIYIL